LSDLYFSEAPKTQLSYARSPTEEQHARTARQLGITREGLYKKRPTLTGIARALRNRGLVGVVS
jgi:hypothetical protein